MKVAVDRRQAGEGGARRGAIDIVSLSHSYEGSPSTLVLGGIDLHIDGGQFVCLLGASGCGKSTLLMLIAGLIRPRAGQILLDGAPVSGPSKERGVVFQEYALLPWKTVRANVELGPRLQGQPRAKARSIASHYLEMVGLADSAKKFPHELSGGMRQRAAVARTLAAEPTVLLMDEPFAAVDAQTRRVLQEELVGIWSATQRTVVFVTHSVEEAALLADRVVVLAANPGRVCADIAVTAEHSQRFRIDGTTDHGEVSRQLLAALALGREGAP